MANLSFDFKFENDVKEYGIQTIDVDYTPKDGFENDVKEYGIQTMNVWQLFGSGFENDVKEYGIQTQFTPSS